LTGYAAVMLLAIRLGATIVLQDVWTAKQGVDIMVAEGVRLTPPRRRRSLTDICDTVAAGATRPARLRSFLCGGAPIPPMLIEARGPRARPPGLLAVGHDRVAVEHADRAGARRREVVVDRRPAARGSRHQDRRRRGQVAAEPAKRVG
jgi:hypothetical protein